MQQNKAKNIQWLEDLESLFFLETGNNLCIEKININLDSYDANYENSVRNPKFAAIYNMHEMLIALDNNIDTALISIYEIEQDLLSAELYRKVLFGDYNLRIHRKLLCSIELLEKNIEQLWINYTNDQIINFELKYTYNSVTHFFNDVYEILLSLRAIERQLLSRNSSASLSSLSKTA
jgi:hypothetical protein